MDGVDIVIQSSCYSFYVEYFSDELREAIRNNLSAICHGDSHVSPSIIYSYKNTLKEFLCRYNGKNQETKIGFIGELLAHVFIRETLNDFSIDSPYFNLEERSIKKGFDIIMDNKLTKELWITEVKSGNIHKSMSATETIKDLIETAKYDLKGRLNDTSDEAAHLWLNAIHGAESVLSKNVSKRDAIVDILENHATLSGNQSKDFNVILIGSLFHDLNVEKFDNDEVVKKRQLISSKSIFNKVLVIAIQKSTHDAIYDFLKNESSLP